MRHPERRRISADGGIWRGMYLPCHSRNAPREIPRPAGESAGLRDDATNVLLECAALRQAEAMMSLNVAEPFGDSLEKATGQVKARVLVIVGKEDHMVTPGPAIEFAYLLGAKLL